MPYDIALELKKIGFDDICFSYYDQRDTKNPVSNMYCKNSGGWLLGDNCAAPLYQQAIDFLRKQQIQVIELPKKKHDGGSSIRPSTNMWTIVNDSNVLGGGYGRALAIRKALELIKPKSD